MMPSNKHLANFVWLCMGLGLARGAFAGLFVAIGAWLFSLLYDFNLETAKQSLFFLIYTPLISIPLAGGIGLCLGWFFGIISFGILRSANNSRLVNFSTLIVGMSIAASIIAVGSINYFLSRFSVTDSGPEILNPFSIPGALIAFVFVFTSRSVVMKYMENSKSTRA